MNRAVKGNVSLRIKDGNDQSVLRPLCMLQSQIRDKCGKGRDLHQRMKCIVLILKDEVCLGHFCFRKVLPNADFMIKKHCLAGQIFQKDTVTLICQGVGRRNSQKQVLCAEFPAQNIRRFNRILGNDDLVSVFLQLRQKNIGFPHFR